MLIGGGVRCGKSAFALQRARELGDRRVFIATAQAFDAEMRARIDAHQAERGGAFETIEEPLALTQALRTQAARADVVVIDCLTLWLSNLLLHDLSDDAIADHVAELAAELAQRRCHSVLVTNEVGMGLVPDNVLGRRFRDCVGRAHQVLTPQSDELYFGVLGSLLRMRPAPLGLVDKKEPHATHP